jgi:hypothetical protein
MIPDILVSHQFVEAALAGVLLLLLAIAIWHRSARVKQRAADPEILPEIVEALTVYLGGNRDSARLRGLSKSHPEEVRDTILRYQAVVAGRREELCELTIELGCVQYWCHETHATDVRTRRKAFASIAAVAHYEPVRRIVGNIPTTAFRDPDEQIRLEAARILLSSGVPAEVDYVFAGVLADTPAVRQGIAAEFGRYAIELCEVAIPRALRSPNPREVLSLLVSWERALPLPDVGPLAEHADPAVRVEVMRLLPFLPPTAENRAAALRGLGDQDQTVGAAAIAAADRLKIPNRVAVEKASWPVRTGQEACPTGGYSIAEY